MRIGLHINQNAANPVALDYCARVKPAFMKWLSPDPAFVRECRRVSPATKHIGRVVWSPQDHENRGRFNSRVLDAAREFKGLIDCWEGFNEAIGDRATPAEIKAFARDEVVTAQKLNEAGVGALIGGFSTGTLDDGKLEAFTHAFDYMNAVGSDKCALHFHEYSAAYMAYQVKTRDGLNQWPNGANGHPVPNGFNGISTDPNIWWDPTLRGWLNLRYRDLIPLVERRWPNVRFVITESPIDDTPGKQPIPGASGWKGSRGTRFETIPGLGNYAGQGRWLAWQWSHDRIVLGGVDFGNGDERWESFRLDNEPAMLEQWIAGQLTIPIGYITPGGQPVPAPAPTPSPVPVPPPTPTTPVKAWRSYTVKAGDTAFGIAKRELGRGQRWQELRDLAALTPLNPGDVILIPEE